VAHPDTVVNLSAQLGRIDDHWSPHIVAAVNDLHVKVVKVEGEFVWHHHDDTDELFLVVAGQLTIELPERQVTLGPGELFVVPRGVDHRPVAESECSIVLLEPAGTSNTGSADSGPDRAASTTGRWLS